MRTVFIHIPKCGGNSVEAKLRYNEIPHTRIEPEHTLADMPESGLITGHISYDQFEGDSDAKFFSVMRSPLDRALSHYYYTIAKADSPEYEIIKGYSIDHFLMHHSWDNQMCRMMFGHKIFDTHNTDANRFDACVKILNERYLFVGKIEDMIHVDLWLAMQLGCEHFSAHENKNAHDKSLASQTRLKFMHKNIVDYMMYEFIGLSKR